MNRTVAIAIALASAAAGCRAAEPPITKSASCADCAVDALTKNLMRTYQVPPGQEKMVERLLRGNSYPIQTAGPHGPETDFIPLKPQFTGDGYFVLSAPAAMHDGVKELLEELKTRAPHAGPPAVETTYWVVLGWPSAKTEVPDQLAAIAPALSGIVDLGPMRFEPYEKLQVTSLDGEEASAVANRAEVRQTASADKDTIDVRLEIKVIGGDRAAVVQTAVRVKPGQFAVLGQAGWKPQTPGLSDVRPTMFYVVRSRPST